MRIFILALFAIFTAVSSLHGQPPSAAYFNPEWSPDGKKITFESSKSGKFAVYVINTDGTELQKLTSDDSDSTQPSWSPTSKQIAFVSNRDGPHHIYIMNADGSEQRRLTDSPDDDLTPSFSPKGDHIVFVSKPASEYVGNIFVISTSGAGRGRLTEPLANFSSPQWAPNGKTIVFTSNILSAKNPRQMTEDERKNVRNSNEIYVIDKNGKDMKNLTNNSFADAYPRWSKNGKSIYFLSFKDAVPNIYRMGPNGSNVRQVAAGSIVPEPNISPDETRFCYSKQVEGTWGIYVYTIKTREVKLLAGG